MSDERAQQLEERLIEETQRLEKLYVAYRRLEEELQEKNAEIERNREIEGGLRQKL